MYIYFQINHRESELPLKTKILLPQNSPPVVTVLGFYKLQMPVLAEVVGDDHAGIITRTDRECSMAILRAFWISRLDKEDGFAVMAPGRCPRYPLAWILVGILRLHLRGFAYTQDRGTIDFA